MARVWSSGFELNWLNTSGTQGEWERNNSGSFSTISTTTVRSGSYSMRFTGFSSNTIQNAGFQLLSAAGTGNYYARAYFNFATFPGGNPAVMSFQGASGSNFNANIRCTSSGQLQLHNTTTQVGSDSTTLSTGTWYCVELHVDNSGAAGTHTLEARIDGSTFATSSTQTVLNLLYFGIGRLNSAVSTVGDYYVDDVAINDTTGSFQNSWPGSGKIIHLRPNGAGDSAGFTRGGTDTGANYSQTSEVTPDDVTTYNTSTTLNAEDLFNVTDSGIAASDSVSLVSVGARFSASVATSVPTFVIEAEKTSGGTKAQSAGITPNATGWRTNAIAAPGFYPLTLYQDPDATNWTQSTIDSMQIGYKLTVDNTNNDLVSTVWALVEYVPAAVATNVAPSAQIAHYPAFLT